MEKKQKGPSKWLTLIVVTIGFFMVKLDSSIVNLAISKMMSTFNASFDQIQWVLSAYSLALGIVMATTAYLSGRFGSKMIFIFSLILFTSGSLLCGFAWNTMSIVSARIIQGLGGGMLIPVGMTLLLTTFEESERGIVFAVMGIGNLFAPAIGPTLGGYLIENFDWRLIFFINIPIGVLGIFLSFLFLKESEYKPAQYFDLQGFLTSGIGLGCVLYVLGKGDVDWGDMQNLILMVTGCLSLLVFIIHELRTEEPMLDLRLFKDYNFSMGNIIMIIAVMGLFGGIFLVPVFLQQLKGLTPFQAGLVLFPEAIASAVSMVIASRLNAKIDTRILTVLALLLLAFNSWNMSTLTFDTSNSTVTMLLLVRGLGFGFLIIPIQTAALSKLQKESMSNASALMQTVIQVGTAVGLTIITSVLQQRNTINYANLSQQVTPYNANSMEL